MASGSRSRRTRRSRPLQRVERSEDDREEPESVEQHPISIPDLRAVRLLLMQLGLPAELVYSIIDEAEYYPVVRGRYVGPQISLDATSGCQTRGGSCAAQLCMLTPPIPGGAPDESFKVKRVTWTIRGHDQGWGGERPGTFRSAYSWYEACIFRPVPSEGSSTNSRPGTAHGGGYGTLSGLLRRKYCAPKDTQDDLQEAGYSLVPVPGTHPASYTWLVQRNKAAKRDHVQYCLQWTAGEHVDPAKAEDAGRGIGAGFIESLQPGDRIGLWMRAQYPGWANFVKKAEVEVLYDVY